MSGDIAVAFESVRALLLTTPQTLLDGTNLPHAVRDIIFGLVVPGAVLALRERSTR
jgi:ribose transport system permease protein